MSEQAFPEFAAGVGLGLYKAVTEDSEVFLLTTGCLLSASRSARLRGLGKAMVILFAARRADQYAGLFATKLDQIALVMREGNSRPRSQALDPSLNIP